MITKKFKFLSVALLFSVALNVGLIAAYAYFGATESGVALLCKRGESRPLLSNGQVISSMAQLSFRELVSFLTNRDLIEEGYAKRDLALATLVAYHHFNLEKALSAKPPQVRPHFFSKTQTIDLFPGLNEEQFEAIIRFAYQEKWPLTAKGLFAQLLLQKEGADESLRQAFFLTPEFYSLQRLFQKKETPEVLLGLVLEGSWSLLEQFFKEQSQVLELSDERRTALLLEYAALQSPQAAQLLLKTDFTYALKRLEDEKVIELLSLLKEPTELGKQYCIELLRSARKDAVWQKAALNLYSYAGEMPALPIEPSYVLARFARVEPPRPAPPSKKSVLLSPSQYHVVKEGESLWKISRQYKVKVDEIAKINGLENNSLYPGMTLKIPQGTGSEPPR